MYRDQASPQEKNIGYQRCIGISISLHIDIAIYRFIAYEWRDDLNVFLGSVTQVQKAGWHGLHQISHVPRGYGRVFNHATIKV